MTAARISCPSCATTLRSSADPGTKIRCPSCKSIFKVEAPEEEEDKPRRPAAVTAEKPKRRSVRDEDEEEEEDEDETQNDDEEDERPSRSKSGIKRGASSAAIKGKAGKGASKHDDEDEEDDEDDRSARKGGKKKKKAGSNNALLIGLLVVGVLLAGGAAFFFLGSGGKDEKQSARNDSTPPDNLAPPPVLMQQNNGGQNSGALNADVLARAKKATVFIRVTAGDGSKGSGSGFFGVRGRPTLVLTNAHVIGMLEKGAKLPQKVEIVINSGESNEHTVPGRVFKADPGIDLAVVEVAGAPPAAGWPAALEVKNAGGLRETEKLYVLGYPYGEQLGKNVTVRESSVASLRKNRGILETLQVNGGMDPGNSGGPVIDAQGNVVGVAVSGLRNTTINFAIPGEKVQSVLSGRISDRGLGDPYKKNGELVVRMSLQTVDPFQSIRDMKIDFWYGNEGKERLGGAEEPRQEEGDLPRRTATVEYQSRLGVGVVDLPLQTMPAKGKVLWVQPHMVDGSQTQRWSDAVCVKLAPPTEDAPAMLQRVAALGRSPLDLVSKEKYVFKSGGGDRALTRQLKARFWEDLRSSTPTNSLAYCGVVPGSFSLTAKIHNQDVELPPPVVQMLKDFDKIGMVIEYDHKGMRTRDDLDDRKVPKQTRRIMHSLAKQLQAALEVMTVPLPNEEAQPGKTWEESKAMPLDFAPDEDDADLADLRMTYTYRGMRTLPPEDGGHKQAVIDLVGSMKGSGKSSEVKGEARGDAVFDMKEQRFVKVKVNFEMNSRIHILGETVKAEGVMDVELTRGPRVPLPDNLPSIETFGSTPEQTGGLFETHRLAGNDEVTALSFSPDGHTLAVATRTTVTLWDPTTGRQMDPRIVVGMRGGVRSVAFAGNSRLVVGGTNAEGTALGVYDITSERGERKALMTGHTKPVTQVWITANAAIAVSASEDGTVRLWNAATGDQLALIEGNVGPIKAMAVTTDGRYALVQGTATAALDLLQRRRLTPKDTNHNITHMTAIDGRRVLCGCEDGSVRIVDAGNGKELNNWKHHQGKVDYVSVRSDGKRALSTGAGGTLTVWDPMQTDAKAKPWTTKAPSSYGMTALSPSPTASYFACVRPQSSSVSLLKLEVPTK